jgi:dethiobiotin synthetase
MRPIFITGIGTGIGKTLVSAIVTEALDAMYWKPVQAGFAEGTDTEWVGERISRPDTRLIPEAYLLALAASPHIAARHEGISISLDKIVGQWHSIQAGAADITSANPFARDRSPHVIPPRPLVIEGAGGLLVPLNREQFVLDLVKRLEATVILVSRNYLGSINHSLLTAAVCKAHNIRVAGWIFNDQYLQYESEIVQWTAIPAIASIPFRDQPDKEFVGAQAESIRPALLTALGLPG